MRRDGAEMALVGARLDDLRDLVDRVAQFLVAGEEVRAEPDAGLGTEVAEDLRARPAPCGPPRTPARAPSRFRRAALGSRGFDLEARASASSISSSVWRSEFSRIGSTPISSITS